MYSQHDEDKILAEYFGDRVGRFLDVGAQNGQDNSNTRALVERGWDGVCVEPDPFSMAGLVRWYKASIHVQIVQAAVVIAAKQTYICPFWTSCGDGLSTTSVLHREKWTKISNPSWAQMHVATITWAELLRAFPGPYDFVNIDTEGTSDKLFREAIAEHLRPDVFCVELDVGPTTASAFAKRYGYECLSVQGSNILLAKPKE